MLLTLKTSISFYKANFTQDFIKSVKNGVRRTHPFVIQKYCPQPSIAIGRSKPGLDIVDPKDRKDCIKILHSISASITRAIPI